MRQQLRNLSRFVCVVLSIVCALSPAVLGAATPTVEDSAPGAHPRLFMTPERVQKVRTGIADPTSHYARAVAALRARVDSSDFAQLSVYADHQNFGYRRTWLAREAAFLAVIHADTDLPLATAYATKAYDALWAVFHDEVQDRHLIDNSGLSRAMMGKGFALVYDWCLCLMDACPAHLGA